MVGRRKTQATGQAELLAETRQSVASSWEQEERDRYRQSGGASREPVGLRPATAKEQRPHPARQQPGRGGPPGRRSFEYVELERQRQEPLRQRRYLEEERRTPYAPPGGERASRGLGTGTRPLPTSRGLRGSNVPSERGYPEAGLTQSGLFPIGKPWIRPPLYQGPFGIGGLWIGALAIKESWRSPSLDRAPIERAFDERALKAAAQRRHPDNRQLDDLRRAGARSRSLRFTAASGPTPPGRSLPGRPSGRFRARPSLMSGTPGCEPEATPNGLHPFEPDQNGESPRGKAGAGASATTNPW